MENEVKTSILHRALATTLTEEELTQVSGGMQMATTRYYWTENCTTSADYGRDND